MKLQKVLNACIRFIFDLAPGEVVETYSKDIHILPVKFRIIFKLCVISYKILNGLAPDYLQDKVQIKNSNSQRDLRSNFDFTLLELPVQYRKTGHYKLAEHWNMLPINIRESSSLNIFCSLLKTHLFTLAYE